MSFWVINDTKTDESDNTYLGLRSEWLTGVYDCVTTGMAIVFGRPVDSELSQSLGFANCYVTDSQTQWHSI